MRKHGGTPCRRDTFVTLAAISPPSVARGRFVRGHKSGPAESKPPPLFKRRASSCFSQRQRQREPWGASPRANAPTYQPTSLPSPAYWARIPLCGSVTKSLSNQSRRVLLVKKGNLNGSGPTSVSSSVTVQDIQGIQNEMADYVSRNDFDTLLAASSKAFTKEVFQRMDVQLHLSMCTAGVLEH